MKRSPAPLSPLLFTTVRQAASLAGNHKNGGQQRLRGKDHKLFQIDHPLKTLVGGKDAFRSLKDSLCANEKG